MTYRITYISTQGQQTHDFASQAQAELFAAGLVAGLMAGKAIDCLTLGIQQSLEAGDYAYALELWNVNVAEPEILCLHR